MFAQIFLWPSESFADLVAVGDMSTPSYRTGVALSAVVTLGSGSQPVNLSALSSGGDDSDHLQSVLGRVADFAVLDIGQLSKGGMPANQLSMVRAVAVIQNTDDSGTVLVTHQEKDGRQVQAVMQALFSNNKKLAVLLSASASSDPAPVLKDIDLELHPAAARFYEEASQGGLVADSDQDDNAASSNLSTDASPNPTVQNTIETAILRRERDELANDFRSLSAQQQSMAERLREAERNREVMVTELETLKQNASENEAALAQLRKDVEVARSERGQASRRRDELQQRVDNVTFQSVEEAAQSADAMRQRAETAESRYEEAFDVAEACLQQRQGGGIQAREALQQIEQLEQRLQQVTGAHQQCIADLEASAN
ncbi:MAG: hypothetical protein AAGA21_22960 [Pseudomonadota bacterium]